MIVEYSIEGYQPVIHLFYRDENRKRIWRKIMDYEPYFYIDTAETFKSRNLREVKKLSGGFYSIDGKNVSKVTVGYPKDIRKLREFFDKTYETDIPFTTKYIIDKVVDFPKYEMRVLYLDIEVAAERAFPNVLKAEVPITCISTYDNYAKKFYVWTWRKDLKNESINDDAKQIRKFNLEEDMLNDFIGFIRMTDPDILTGWNIIGFDIRYLISRMDRLGCYTKSMSPMNSVYNENTVSIKGRIIFDLILGYRRLTSGRAESYKLDFVARKELGEEKIKMKKSWKKMWEENLDELLEYNLKDIDLTRKIDEKLKIIDFHDEIRRIVKCNYNDIHMNSRIIDTYILNKLKGRMVLPSKKRVQSEMFKGAVVLKPAKGLYDNVIALDLRSLYPSVIVSCNMSPETISARGDIKLKNGISFLSIPKGVVPEIITELFKERKRYRKLMAESEYGSDIYNTHDKKQYAIKVILNSLYGVLGFDKFRLYDRKIAESVTWVGREIIMWSKAKAESLGYTVIYGDTDSLYIKGKSVNIDDLIKEGNELKDRINESYKEFSMQFGIKEHIFDIQFEKIFERILFSEAKKRYAGLLVWHDGKPTRRISITGFDTIRSDSSQLSRTIQKKVFDLILHGSAEKEVKEYIRDEIKKIKKGDYSYTEIAIPKGITKELTEYTTNVAHIRGVLYSNQNLNTNFAQGDKPKVLWIKKTPSGYPKTDIICIDDTDDVPEGFEVDMDMMVERLTEKKLSGIFDAMGWDYKSLVHGYASLNDFMIDCM